MSDLAISGGRQPAASGAAPRYDLVAGLLHWAIAVLVLAMLVLGYTMVEVPRQTPARGQLFNLHKSLGLLVLALMVVRTLWRLGHRPPPPPDGIGVLNARLASAVHLLLYVLLLAQPMAGYVASSLGRYGVEFFGLPLPDWTDEDPALREIFLGAHHLIAKLLVALILLHLAGTLFHLVRGQGAILGRIAPWRAG